MIIIAQLVVHLIYDDNAGHLTATSTIYAVGWPASHGMPQCTLTASGVIAAMIAHSKHDLLVLRFLLYI